MQRTLIHTTLLASALACGIALAAPAQPNARGEKEKELAAAREQLQQAAKRVAALSRELGRPGDGAFVFEHRFASKPVLGVLLDEDAGRGVRIVGVTPESGAAAAQLATGDRIVEVDGKPVTGATGAERLERLRAMLDRLEDGKPVRIGFERGGRTAVASVTPRQAAPLTLHGEDGSSSSPRGDVKLLMGADGRYALEAKEVIHRPAPGQPLRIEYGPVTDEKGRVIREARVEVHPPMRPAGPGAAGPGIDRDVLREVVRIARDAPCKDGQDCRTIALSEAFRWNGLNLASVDARLGRYFGTDSGVLVVSAGPELAGLQSGDVIRRVEGQAVRSPREVMDRLRGKPEGETVAIEVLRDRRTTTAQLKAPKAMRIPLPPPPPATAPLPPAPPAPPAANAPPAPPAPPTAFEFDGGAARVAIVRAPAAPRPPRAPAPLQRID